MSIRLRPTVKAIIIRDGRLLLTRNVDPRGEFYLLPGGGLEPGETLHEAMRRECLEEVGARVRVGPLRLIRDYIGRNHEFAAADGHVHQVELMFECTLEDGCEPANGPVPDSMQTGIAWLPLEALDRHRVYPAALAAALRGGPPTEAVYLGDVN